MLDTHARLAQSVEHQTFNLRVAGSSPSSGGGSFKRRPMESVSGTLNSLESHCRGPLIPKNQAYLGKNLAPGEARTPDLRISLSVLTYKYDALTDCATGAENHCPAFYGTHCENESAWNKSDKCARTRKSSLQLPYKDCHFPASNFFMS